MIEERPLEVPASDPDNPLVQAVLAESEFAAQTKAAVLQDDGIEAYVFSAERSWTGGLSLAPGMKGVPVWVRKSDLDRAQAALKQRIADSVDLDWDEVDVGEPEAVGVNAGAESELLRFVIKLGWFVAAAIVLALIYTFLMMVLG